MVPCHALPRTSSPCVYEYLSAPLIPVLSERSKIRFMLTQGDPANANNKHRPEKLLLWDNFPTQQAAIWDDLMESEFGPAKLSYEG